MARPAARRGIAEHTAPTAGSNARPNTGGGLHCDPKSGRVAPVSGGGPSPTDATTVLGGPQPSVDFLLSDARVKQIHSRFLSG
jgi:hypothetical protein